MRNLSSRELELNADHAAVLRYVLERGPCRKEDVIKGLPKGILAVVELIKHGHLRMVGEDLEISTSGTNLIAENNAPAPVAAAPKEAVWNNPVDEPGPTDGIAIEGERKSEDAIAQAEVEPQAEAAIAQAAPPRRRRGSTWP